MKNYEIIGEIYKQIGGLLGGVIILLAVIFSALLVKEKNAMAG